MNQYDTIKCTYDNICKQLKENRNKSGVTIDIVAEWLKVDRRKIIALENCERLDLELLCNYADIYGIEIKLNYKLL